MILFKNKIKSILTLFLVCALFFSSFSQKIVVSAEQLSVKEIMTQVKSGKITNFTYELFGAKGDGKTNDFQAIKTAHETANDLYLEGYPVVVQATKGKTYRIAENAGASITVITDVNFNNANFIIDDTNPYLGKGPVSSSGQTLTTVPVFNVTSPMHSSLKSNLVISNPALGSFKVNEQTKYLKEIVDLIKNKLDDANNIKRKPFFTASNVWAIKIEDEDERLFFRKSAGNSGSGGYNKTDFILVDPTDGKVLTPIDWSYNNITSITAFPIPDNPITIQNATFTTKANKNLTIVKSQLPDKYPPKQKQGEKSEKPPYIDNYNYRGIKVSTTGNVNIKNITHFLENQDEMNAYYGFIFLSNSANINLENVKLTPHKPFGSGEMYNYDDLGDPRWQRTSNLGTYDFIIENSVNVDVNKMSYACNIKKADGSLDYNACYKKSMINNDVWGLIASNHSKNLFFRNSRVNRIDAHRGVTNLLISGDDAETLNDCVIGNKGLNLIGKGRTLIKNCKFDEPSRIVNLRSDYGSTYDGLVFIDNILWYLPPSSSTASFIYSDNPGATDFGYVSVFPQFYVNNINVQNKGGNNPQYKAKNINLIRLNESVQATNNEEQKYKFKGNSNFVKIKTPSGVTMDLFTTNFVKNQNNLNINNYGNNNQISLVYTKDGGSAITNSLSGKTSTQFKYVENSNAQDAYNKQAKINNEFFKKLIEIDTKLPNSTASQVALKDKPVIAGGYQINEEYSPSRTTYSVNVPYTVKELSFSYFGNSNSILSDSEYVEKIENIKEGKNIHTFSVVGYKTRKDYTLVVNRDKAPTSVNVPTCNNLTYNTQKQNLVNPNDGYSLTNNSQTNAGTYKVVAALNSGYIWKDSTTKNKELTCKINKATPNLTYAPNNVVGIEGNTGEITISSDVKGKFTLTSSDSKKASLGKTSAQDVSSIKSPVTFKSQGSGNISIKFNVNSNYNSVEISVPFIVQAKPSLGEIDIYSNSSPSITYDGNSHVVEGIENDKFEVDGETYTVTNISATTGEMKNVGSYTNKISGQPIVLNSKGEDETERFTINLIEQEVEITPREISLSQEDYQAYTTGKEIYNNKNIIVDNLVSGHEFTVDYIGSHGVELGVYDNYQFNSITIFDNEEDVSNNYYVSSAQLGTLTLEEENIQPVDITLTANSYNGTYDGNYHTASGFESLTFEHDNKTYIVDGITSHYEGKNVSDSIEEIEIQGTPVVYDENGNDVSKYFSISLVKGSFTIEKKHLLLISGSFQKTRDGEPLTNLHVENKLPSGLIKEEGFADDEGAIYFFPESITEEGEVLNTFIITPLQGTILDNYEIETQYGSLTILSPQDLDNDELPDDNPDDIEPTDPPGSDPIDPDPSNPGGDDDGNDSQDHNPGDSSGEDSGDNPGGNDHQHSDNPDNQGTSSDTGHSNPPVEPSKDQDNNDNTDTPDDIGDKDNNKQDNTNANQSNSNSANNNSSSQNNSTNSTNNSNSNVQNISNNKTQSKDSSVNTGSDNNLCLHLLIMSISFSLLIMLLASLKSIKRK